MKYYKKHSGGNSKANFLKFESILKHYFDEKLGNIKMDTFGEVSADYKMHYKDQNQENECFDITIDQNKNQIIGNTLQINAIKYPKGNKCLMSGPEILVRLYHAAKDMKLRYIALDDSCRIYFDGGCSLLLTHYYILLHGKSWYNTFGYYSNNYREELVKNRIFETRTLEYYKNRPKICNDVIKQLGVNYDTTIRKIMEEYDILLKDGSKSKCGVNGLFLTFEPFFDLVRNDIFYNGWEIILDLEDKQVEKIYNDKTHIFDRTILDQGKILMFEENINIKGGTKRKRKKKNRSKKIKG